MLGARPWTTESGVEPNAGHRGRARSGRAAQEGKRWQPLGDFPDCRQVQLGHFGFVDSRGEPAKLNGKPAHVSSD